VVSLLLSELFDGLHFWAARFPTRLGSPPSYLSDGWSNRIEAALLTYHFAARTDCHRRSSEINLGGRAHVTKEDVGCAVSVETREETICGGCVVEGFVRLITANQILPPLGAKQRAREQFPDC